MKGNTDNNFRFVETYLQQKIKLYKDILSLHSRQLRRLDNDERKEWVQIMTLKAKTLFDNNNMTPDLKITVVILVCICKEYDCEYDAKMIQNMLKQIYTQETAQKLSNAELVKIFKEAGFDTRQCQLLIYEDPWYTRFSRWLLD